MIIKELKLNDPVIEHNPYGFSMIGMVWEKPYLENGQWCVEVITKPQIIYTYRQFNDGNIYNDSNQKTILKKR